MSKPKQYTEEFKKQIVALYNSGKSGPALEKEYGVSKTTIYGWVKMYANSGSFKLSDNMSESEKKLRKLEKENKQLRMENDILKQAALIMGRK